MPEYKNNHTIPGFLLQQWESYALGRYGVYQYDLGHKKINFASSRKKGRFSFASKNYFYVPLVKNERQTVVEKWLSDMEGLLSTVVKKLNEGTEDLLVRDRDEADKLLMGLFSLRHRTESAINSIRKFIEDHPEVKLQMNVSEDRDIHLIVLENMIHATRENAIDYRNYKITVFRSDSEQFIIGDQPFLGDVMNNGSHFVVLSPKFCISIQKNPENAYFSYMDTTPEILNLFNRSVAGHARKWIVAKDRLFLEKYLPTADEPKQDDTPLLEIPKYILNADRIA